MSKSHRIFYADGPGGVVQSFRKWSARDDTSSETQLTLSGQFFNFCRAYHVPGYAVSSHPERALVRSDEFVVENRPKPLRNRRGLWYHVSQVCYGLSLVVSALRFGATVAVINSGSTHWWVLSLLSLARVRVVPCLHNTFWPSGVPPSTGLAGVIGRAVDGWFWRHCAVATLCVSPECERQIASIAGSRIGPVVQFRAQYRASLFQAVAPPPPHNEAPFRVVYVGRVQREKGVWDVVEIAERLERAYPGRFRFEMCGGGTELDELTRAVTERGLDGVVKILGRVTRLELLAAYGRSHVVIIPTRSSFSEGMPAVAAEAVLAGRPMLTSRLSNALDELGPAILEAQPDDVESYVSGLESLMTDGAIYGKLSEACSSLREQFVDWDHGFEAALGRVVGSLAG